MARSSSIALESAAQDGSCWPIVAYSVPRPRSTWASAMRCSGASMGLPPHPDALVLQRVQDGAVS